MQQRQSLMQFRNVLSTPGQVVRPTLTPPRMSGARSAFRIGSGARPPLPSRYTTITASTTNGGGSAGSGGTGSGGFGGSGSSGNGASPPSHPMQPWTFVLAALLAVGGAIGFMKKGSAKSLGGGFSGALILALAARAMTGPSMQAGVRVAFGVTLMLGVFFVSRYARSKKIMPAGLGAGVSLSYAAAYVATGL